MVYIYDYIASKNCVEFVWGIYLQLHYIKNHVSISSRTYNVIIYVARVDYPIIHWLDETCYGHQCSWPSITPDEWWHELLGKFHVAHVARVSTTTSLSRTTYRRSMQKRSWRR